MNQARLTLAVLMSDRSRQARLAEQQRQQDKTTVVLMTLCSTIIAIQIIWSLLN